MRRRSALVVTIALALAACGGGDDDPTAASTTSTEAATTEAPAPETSGAPTTTAPSGPTATTAEARDAANELKAAWEAGDQARARAIAPGEAVDALFAVPAGGFEVYGCDSAQFEFSSCNWRNRASGAYVSVSMRKLSEGAWQVDSLTVTQD